MEMLPHPSTEIIRDLATESFHGKFLMLLEFGFPNKFPGGSLTTLDLFASCISLIHLHYYVSHNRGEVGSFCVSLGSSEFYFDLLPRTRICLKQVCCVVAGSDSRKLHSLDPRPCQECGRVYSNLSNLRQHMKLIHNPTYVECAVCRKSFKTDLYLRRHMISAHHGHHHHNSHKNNDYDNNVQYISRVNGGIETYFEESKMRAAVYRN